MRRPRKGDEAKIYFLDHCENDDKPMECAVRGRIASAKGKWYVVESWTCAEEEANKNNRTIFSILKSTVLKAVVMVEQTETAT